MPLCLYYKHAHSKRVEFGASLRLFEYCPYSFTLCVWAPHATAYKLGRTAASAGRVQQTVRCNYDDVTPRSCYSPRMAAGKDLEFKTQNSSLRLVDDTTTKITKSVLYCKLDFRPARAFAFERAVV
jgi:hypothetical protein